MKQRRPGPFVMHTLALLNSPAWRALSREAHLLLARIEIEHMKHGGKQNGALIVPHGDLENYISGYCRVVSRALRDAEVLGLLKIRRGRAGIGKWRQPNAYRLTYLETEGQEATDEWAEIKTIDDAKARLASVKRRRRASKWLNAGATVIDVGINRVTGGGRHRIVGDVAFDEVREVAGAITPVPGGVGPMTIACLLANTVRAACALSGLPAPAL